MQELNVNLQPVTQPNNSAESKLRTPIFIKVEITFTEPAINNATTECSYRNAADVVNDINVKNI